LIYQGWEQQLSINHGGHALLTLLLCRSQQVKPAVVNLSSVGHLYAAADGVLFHRHQSRDGYDPVYCYASSKLANIAFTKWLSVRGVFSLAVHPGLVDTGLWQHMSRAGSIASRIHAVMCGWLMKTPAQACTGICRVMLPGQPDRPVSGSYCADGEATIPTRIACDARHGNELLRETHEAIVRWFHRAARSQLGSATHDLVAQYLPTLLNV
jgi:NAD(P)-dependent dehydrogenase (short-subunit alcohol dehydrogenase family)